MAAADSADRTILFFAEDRGMVFTRSGGNGYRRFRRLGRTMHDCGGQQAGDEESHFRGFHYLCGVPSVGWRVKKQIQLQLGRAEFFASLDLLSSLFTCLPNHRCPNKWLRRRSPCVLSSLRLLESPGIAIIAP